MNSPDNPKPRSNDRTSSCDSEPYQATPSQASASSAREACFVASGATPHEATEADRDEGSSEFRHACLVLALTPGVGAVTYRRLIEQLGSARAALDADFDTLCQVDGIGVVGARAIQLQSRNAARIVDEVETNCQRDKQQWLTTLDDAYPNILRETSDPPPLLFCKGRLAALRTMGIGIVGTRHATRYGARQAERIAAELAGRGLTVTSGLARGIDAAAHRATLRVDGTTIAVLGGGLDRVFPGEHRSLADEITEHGLLLSEHPPGFPPRGGVFPQRNRVIAGMSLAVMVIEAGLRSGALITARHALEQNREVLALPGPVDSPVSRGCHQLIRDGAALLESIDDLWELLGPLFEPMPDGHGRVARHGLELSLNPQEKAVLDAVEAEPTLLDTIAEATGLPISRVLATVSALETRGVLRRNGGGRVSRGC